MRPVDVLAFPLRFDADGRAETVVQGSDAHCAQQISQFIQTRPRELPLALGYGIEDPAFTGIDPNELALGLGQFHPGLRVEDIAMSTKMEGTVAVNVKFSQSALGYLDGLTSPSGGVVLGA